jgi:hypothetical protein
MNERGGLVTKTAPYQISPVPELSMDLDNVMNCIAFCRNDRIQAIASTLSNRLFIHLWLMALRSFQQP